MSHQKNNPKSSHRYVLMVPIVLSVFVFFSFRTYYIPIENNKVVQGTKDSIPANAELMDTIYTLDPETYIETVQVVKRKEQPSLDFEKTINKNPEVITYSDTIIQMDLISYTETVIITKGKMIKGYKMLIDNEMRKTNPNYKLIEKWQNEGKRD